MAELSHDDMRDRFKALRTESGLSQDEAARRLGVSTASVSRKERGEQPVTKRDLDAMTRVRNEAVHFGRLGNVPRGTSRLSEPAPSLMPQWLDRLIDDTMLGFARAGATNEQARYIRDVLRSDATLRFVLTRDDGASRELADQESQIGDLIEGLRFWIERSQHVVGGIQPPATPGGSPIAPVYATEEPTAAKPETKRVKK